MMTKLEYLKILEDTLKTRLSRREVDEIMRDYAEYFVEGQKQGKSDYEIARNLGDPQEVAQQIIGESQQRGAGQSQGNSFSQAAAQAKETARKAADKTGGCMSFLGKLLLLCAAIMLLPFALGILGAVLLGLLGVLLGFATAIIGCGAGIVSGFICLVLACLCVGTLPATAVGLGILVSIGLVAAGVFGITLLIWLLLLLLRGLKWLCQWAISLFRKPKSQTEQNQWNVPSSMGAENPGNGEEPVKEQQDQDPWEQEKDGEGKEND